MEIDPEKKKKVIVKVVKDANGGRSKKTTTTTTTAGTPSTVIKGTPSTVIKGKPGSPAVLATPGVKGSPAYDRAFGRAVAAGKKIFKFGGSSFAVKLSGTKAKPAVKPTPDVVTPAVPDRVIPATPPTTETTVDEKPIPSAVYKIDATKGTIGGATRAGVGGGITTGSQVTANKDMAERVVKATASYNKDVDRRYSPDTENKRGLNPAQLALKNKNAAQRKADLKGRASVEVIDVQSGLERKKVAELKGGK